MNLQIEDSYSYLGVIFNYNGSFVKARAKLMDQARKALYCLYRKLRNISIPIDLQLKLFDTLILPILTYGCEIWGYENTKQLEKLHLQFCRNILGVRTTTPNFMTCYLLSFGNLDVNLVHFLLTENIKRGNQGIII